MYSQYVESAFVEPGGRVVIVTSQPGTIRTEHFFTPSVDSLRLALSRPDLLASEQELIRRTFWKAMFPKIAPLEKAVIRDLEIRPENVRLLRYMKEQSSNTSEGRIFSQKRTRGILERLKWFMPTDRRDDFLGDLLMISDAMREEGRAELFILLIVLWHTASGHFSRLTLFLAGAAGAILGRFS